VNDSVSDFEESSLNISTAAPLFQKSFSNLSLEASGKLEEELGKNFLVNYMGHGSEYSLGELNTEILNFSKIDAMTNSNHYPLILALNCLSNTFATADPADQSLGEYMLLKENGGAIGLIAANTLLSPINQALFAQYFYDELNRASISTNSNLRVGDILKGAHQRLKLAGLDNSQTDSIILLGDPSLRMPANIFQKEVPFKVSKSSGGSSGGGCSVQKRSLPWYFGLLEMFFAFMLLLVIRRIKTRKD
jgi:hypothetical protein